LPANNYSSNKVNKLANNKQDYTDLSLFHKSDDFEKIIDKYFSETESEEDDEINLSIRRKIIKEKLSKVKINSKLENNKDSDLIKLKKNTLPEDTVNNLRLDNLNSINKNNENNSKSDNLNNNNRIKLKGNIYSTQINKTGVKFKGNFYSIKNKNKRKKTFSYKEINNLINFSKDKINSKFQMIKNIFKKIKILIINTK